jgi:hypothetical protein
MLLSEHFCSDTPRVLVNIFQKLMLDPCAEFQPWLKDQE